ncbi:MAG: cache domain-containing protein [Deltaproteobacteria bacterium]|jgi:PAS domain S-box-containing protein|nr:cache domain-containing protein [Deltaproteobacteria bacterium]
MKPKRRLTQVLLFLMSGVSLASVVLVALLWINNQKYQTDRESQRISREYYANWEKTISLETQSIFDHIASRTAEGQVEFYVGVKNQAMETWNALTRQDPQKIQSNQDLLLSLIAEFKNDDGRPKYFVLDREGQVLTKLGLDFSPDPEVKAIINSVWELGEGFYRFDFTRSWPDQEEKPVAFLKVFEPFGWIVGAASPLAEFQAATKKELLEWATNMPRSWGGDFLILDYSGQVLAATNTDLIDKNLFVEGDSLLTKAAARIIRGAKVQQSSFLRFPLKDEDSGQVRESLGYYRAIGAWRWVALNYIDSGDLARALLEQQNELNLRVKRQIFNVITISVLMLVAIAILGHYISRKASRIFEAFYQFFENAASSSIEMEPERQPFEEFALLAHSVNRMIQQRRVASELLATSEAKYRSVFELSPLLISITDEDSRIVEANAEFANFIGRDLAAVLGQDLWIYFPVDPNLRKKLKLSAMAGQLVQNQEIEVPNRYGDPVTLLFACKGLTIGGADYFLSVCVDITALKASENERLKLQDKLSRSQKMESMGLMAAQVAHELNNILSGMIGYPELLLRDPNLTESQREALQETKESGERAAAVVSDLLTLSKGLASVRVTVDFNDLVTEVLSDPELSDQLTSQKKPVVLERRLASEEIEVLGSASHLKKVLHNIVENAIEAAGAEKNEKTGLVTVTTGQAYVKEPWAGMDNFKPGQFALIAIKDNGPGVSPERAMRIFEPFHSRKPNAGLGLAVVALIVKEHDGAVELKTTDEGAEFRVWLPLATEKKRPVPKPLEEYRGQGQKVLVVDDVDIQRKLAQRMLNTLGYVTHSVPSGEAAVEYLRTNEADLVVLDMIMPPGWNGRQTYEAILAIRPGQKAIIASGMAEGEEVKKAQALGARHFLAKPYTLEDIAGAVHSAISGQLP